MNATIPTPRPSLLLPAWRGRELLIRGLFLLAFVETVALWLGASPDWGGRFTRGFALALDPLSPGTAADRVAAMSNVLSYGGVSSALRAFSYFFCAFALPALMAAALTDLADAARAIVVLGPGTYFKAVARYWSAQFERDAKRRKLERERAKRAGQPGIGELLFWMFAVPWLFVAFITLVTSSR